MLPEYLTHRLILVMCFVNQWSVKRFLPLVCLVHSLNNCRHYFSSAHQMQLDGIAEMWRNFFFDWYVIASPVLWLSAASHDKCLTDAVL